MMSEFVYISVTFNTLFLTKGWSSSIPALDKELASGPKMATFAQTLNAGSEW